MQGQALVCSSAAIQGSAEYAYKMHLDSRMGLGKEIESFFDTLVELNQYIAQGEYYIKMFCCSFKSRLCSSLIFFDAACGV